MYDTSASQRRAAPLQWQTTTVGCAEDAYVAEGTGKYFLLIFDDGSDSGNPGWMVQTCEEDEDGVVIVVDEGILDETDPAAVESAQREATGYVGG